MARYFEPLIMAAIGTASKIVSSQQQMAVLDQTKTLAESALQMLYTAKEAGGNPKVTPMATSCGVLGPRQGLPVERSAPTLLPLLLYWN